MPSAPDTPIGVADPPGDWWHVAWSTFQAWPPTDHRGPWEELGAFYAELARQGARVEVSAALPPTYQERPQPAEAVRLSVLAQDSVRQRVFELAANDRVAGGTVVRALAVGECAVQALIACPEASLQQRVGRLKSASASSGMPAFNPGGDSRTWGRGFWRARLLDEVTVEAVALFIQQVEAEAASRAGITRMSDSTLNKHSMNKHGMTELHLAAYHGELDWVTNCLKGGLDVNARDNGGHTPLWWAADMGRVDGDREAVVDALIAAGADVHARDSSGESVLEAAVRSGNDLIVQRLKNANAT